MRMHPAPTPQAPRSGTSPSRRRPPRPRTPRPQRWAAPRGAASRRCPGRSPPWRAPHRLAALSRRREAVGMGEHGACGAAPLTGSCTHRWQCPSRHRGQGRAGPPRTQPPPARNVARVGAGPRSARGRCCCCTLATAFTMVHLWRGKWRGTSGGAWVRARRQQSSGRAARTHVRPHELVLVMKSQAKSPKRDSAHARMARRTWRCSLAVEAYRPNSATGACASRGPSEATTDPAGIQPPRTRAWQPHTHVVRGELVDRRRDGNRLRTRDCE